MGVEMARDIVRGERERLRHGDGQCKRQSKSQRSR